MKNREAAVCSATDNGPDIEAPEAASVPGGGGLAPIPAVTPVASLSMAGPFTDTLLDEGLDRAADAALTLTLAITRARTRLDRGLAAGVAATGADTDSCTVPPLLRAGHHHVARSARTPLPSSRRDDVPHFRWTARRARRAIGLAALRAGLDGRAAAPADAVGLVLVDPGGPLGVGRAGPASCADWISSLAAPARTVVAAEATSWTTRLWTVVDWGRFRPHDLVIGGPDRWWRWNDPAGRPRVALRGRADVRIRLARDSAPPLAADLVVLDGQPGAGTRHGLMLGPLVDVLSNRQDQGPARVPARVLAWWPECGKFWIVTVDACTLVAAADAVVSAAGAMLRQAAQGA